MKHLLFALVFVSSTYLVAQDFTAGPFENFKLVSPIVGDFTGDGKPDVLGIQFNSGLDDIVMKVNNGTSPIGFSTANLNLSFNLLSKPTAADLDGDGDLDVIVTIENTLDIVMLKNDGFGNFIAVPLGISGAESVKIADMDNDSDLDIVGINSNGSATVYYNNGSLIFESYPLFSSSKNLVLLDLADMDNDGRTDVVLAFDDFTGDQILLFKNVGINLFTQISVVANTFNSIECMVVSDLNSDGLMDIVAARSFNCDLFLNKGNNTFEQSTLIFSNGLVRSLLVGDYNGDGRKDLVLGHNSTNIRWHKNLSNDPLQFDVAVVGGVSPAFSLVNGDLDGDGDTDIITSNGNFWWYENKIVQESSSTSPLFASQIQLSPNPFTSDVYFENPLNDLYLIEVFDYVGKQVYAAETKSSAVNLSDLPQGVYLFKATVTASRITHIAKIIKQ